MPQEYNILLFSPTFEKRYSSFLETYSLSLCLSCLKFLHTSLLMYMPTSRHLQCTSLPSHQLPPLYKLFPTTPCLLHFRIMALSAHTPTLPLKFLPAHGLHVVASRFFLRSKRSTNLSEQRSRLQEHRDGETMEEREAREAAEWKEIASELDGA